MKIDDDTLVAYLDAKLADDAEYEAVEDALAESPALRARLQALAETGELARKAFDAKLEEAVPPQLIAAIMNAPLPPAASAAERGPAQVAGTGIAQGAAPGLGARLAAWFGQGIGAAAFASVVTLAVGTLIGHYLLPPPEAGAPLARQGDAVRDPALVVALQAAPSGLALALGDDRLEITASFAGRDGQFCREYSLSSPQSGQEIGIACRAPAADAGWQLAFIASEPARAAAQGGYATASDRLHEAVDAFLGEHVQDGPFDAARERVLIERGWKAN